MPARVRHASAAGVGARQPLGDVHARRPALLDRAGPIGNLAPKGDERPQIAHVAIADLDRDGLNDVIVCDALRGVVGWIRQAPRGTFTEQTIAGVAAPAHVEAVDFDKRRRPRPARRARSASCFPTTTASAR